MPSLYINNLFTNVYFEGNKVVKQVGKSKVTLLLYIYILLNDYEEMYLTFIIFKTISYTPFDFILQTHNTHSTFETTDQLASFTNENLQFRLRQHNTLKCILNISRLFSKQFHQKVVAQYIKSLCPHQRSKYLSTGKNE